MGSNETATATTGGPRVIMLLLPYFLLPQRRREIKMVLLGASGVGKSSLAQRYARAAARRRVIDVFSHTATQQSQRLLAPTTVCCYDASLGVARRPLRRDGSVSQKIMTKSIKALGGKGAPETILRRAQRAAASLNEAQTRADSLLTIPSLRLSRQPRAVPPGARESRKRGSLWILTPPRPRGPHTSPPRIHNQRWPPQTTCRAQVTESHAINDGPRRDHRPLPRVLRRRRGDGLRVLR